MLPMSLAIPNILGYSKPHSIFVKDASDNAPATSLSHDVRQWLHSRDMSMAANEALVAGSLN